MAHINAEFKHEDYEITVSVLEPTKDEISYCQGMRIDVQWSSFDDLSLKEFRNVLEWMSEKADYIKKNFTSKGKLKR